MIIVDEAVIVNQNVRQIFSENVRPKGKPSTANKILKK